jgi:hypothetical protein
LPGGKHLNLIVVRQDAERSFVKSVRFRQLDTFSDLLILLDVFFSELFDSPCGNDLLSRHTHNALLTRTVRKKLGRRDKHLI